MTGISRKLGFSEKIRKKKFPNIPKKNPNISEKFQILSKFWKFWIIFLLSKAKANICQSVLLLLTQFVVKDFKNVLQL